LSGRHVKSDEDVKEDNNAYLHGLTAEVHCEGIQTLVTVYDKRLNVIGDYTEKYPRVCKCVTLNFSLFYFVYFYRQTIFTICMNLIFCVLHFRYTFVEDPETIIRILHTIKQYVLQHGC